MGGVSFWSDKNILEKVLVMVVQLCEYTKKHWFYMVSLMVNELYLKKLVIYGQTGIYRRRKTTYFKEKSCDKCLL